MKALNIILCISGIAQNAIVTTITCYDCQNDYFLLNTQSERGEDEKYEVQFLPYILHQNNQLIHGIMHQREQKVHF